MLGQHGHCAGGRPPPRPASNPLPRLEDLGLGLGIDNGYSYNYLRRGYSDSLHFGFVQPDERGDADCGVKVPESYAEAVRNGSGSGELLSVASSGTSQVLSSVPSSSTLTADGFDMFGEAYPRAGYAAYAAAYDDDVFAQLDVVQELDVEAQIFAVGSTESRHSAVGGRSGRQWRATLGDYVVSDSFGLRGHKSEKQQLQYRCRHRSHGAASGGCGGGSKWRFVSQSPRSAHCLFASGSSPRETSSSYSFANCSIIENSLLHSISSQSSSHTPPSSNSNSTLSRMCSQH